jgi:hypothetical protein
MGSYHLLSPLMLYSADKKIRSLTRRQPDLEYAASYCGIQRTVGKHLICGAKAQGYSCISNLIAAITQAYTLATKQSWLWLVSLAYQIFTHRRLYAA